MELFLIYLWLKLDTLSKLLDLLSIFSFIAFLGTLFYYAVESGILTPHWKKIFFLLPLIFFSALVPSSKDVAILVGASYAIDLAKSPEGVKVQTLIRKKANDFLDEQLKEAK